MQVVVSISLLSVGAVRIPGAGGLVAEIRMIFKSVDMFLLEPPGLSAGPSLYQTFSNFTKKPLYSGANEFGSTIVGVTRFASAPRCAPRPRKPQWIGNPI